MRRNHWLLALALSLGMAGLALVPAPAAEKADAARIDKLIEQMGSGNFEEREKATEALEAIGVPALEALRKAAAGKDAEVKRRAGELVKKLEKKAESAQVLTPKKVHLVYKETPLAEAIADFRKKSGYAITLHDPEGKLKGRTVSLDTGETTFWHAFDLFCRAAGLVEATPRDLMGTPPVGPALPIGPPGKLPGGAIILPARPAPAAPAPPAPAPKNEKPGAALAEKPRPAAGPPAAPPAPRPVALPANMHILMGTSYMPGLWQGQITLIDGKPSAIPTDASSAIRVRLLHQAGIAGRPADDEIVLWLEVTPEPRLRWQNANAVRIDRAVDDQGQKLAPIEDSSANAGVPGAVRPHIRMAMPWSTSPRVPVRLKKGEKETRSFKELSGTINTNVLTDVRDHITVEKVLEAAGKTVKGREGGSIKVTEVTRGDNNQVTISLEVELPSGVVAEHNPVAAGMMPMMPGGPIPVPPGGGLVPANLAAQVAWPFNGLVLADDKDNALPVQVRPRFKAGAALGGPPTMDYQLIYQPEKGRPAPARLVFKGRKSVTVDIPFTLKDVKLP